MGVVITRKQLRVVLEGIGALVMSDDEGSRVMGSGCAGIQGLNA